MKKVWVIITWFDGDSWNGGGEISMYKLSFDGNVDALKNFVSERITKSNEPGNGFYCQTTVMFAGNEEKRFYGKLCDLAKNTLIETALQTYPSWQIFQPSDFK